MKKIKWFVLIILVSTYSGCHWDYRLSNYLFEEYCNEEGRTGQFIYEQVSLGEEYFTKDPLESNQHLTLNDGEMINKARIERDYDLSKFRNVILLSKIGPISSIETSVVRRSDNKLLGKAISLSNRRGWLLELNILGQNAPVSCPGGYDKNENMYKAGLLHSRLYKNLFIRNIK